MVAVSSCSKSDEEKEQSNTIIGKWELQATVAKLYDKQSKELVKTENITFPKNVKYSMEFKDSGKGDFFGEVKRYNSFDFSYTDKNVQIKYNYNLFWNGEDEDSKVLVEGGDYTLQGNTLVIYTEYSDPDSPVDINNPNPVKSYNRKISHTLVRTK